MRPNKKILFLLLGGCIFSGSISSRSFAEEPSLGATLGTSFELGSVGSADSTLPNRTIDTLGIQALPGFRFGSMLLGLNFRYQWEGQITSPSDAGGTNLSGSGYYVGLGMNYRACPQLAVQIGIDFFGRYNYGRQTNQPQDTYLGSPLALGLKTQYFLTEGSPYSLDLSFQYTRFGNLTVGSTESNQTLAQWSAGLGATLHFGQAGPLGSGGGHYAQAVISTPAPTSFTETKQPTISPTSTTSSP